MALPILSELNQELTRLFVAGSRLSAGDPRLKKFVDPLARLGEKAPVLAKLSRLLEELLEAQPAQSAQKLLETETFLLSILATQGETEDKSRKVQGSEEKPVDSVPRADQHGSTNFSYRALAPVLTALRSSGGGRMHVLETAFEQGIFKDPRIAQAAVDALADNASDMTAFLISDVLPSVGPSIAPYLLEVFDINGNIANGRRLRALYKLMGEQVYELVEDCFDRGSTPVKVEAARILGDFPQSETLLLGGLTEKKDVREAAMQALIGMDSHTGIDKIMALMEKPEAVSAITFGDSPYLAARVLEMLRTRNAALGSGEVISDDVTPDDIRLFAETLELLRNKRSKQVADYLQSLLSGGRMGNMKNPLPKRDEKMTDTVLDILFGTGCGNEFIWEMFRSTQQGVLGKLLGSKKDIPVMLPVYAFKIGAGQLDPEAFYNTFFKTQLYQEIVKLDRNIFTSLFLTDDHPPYSQRIAGYFLRNGDLILAVKTSFPNDTGVLNALAVHLQNNLNNNLYRYENDLILERLGQTGHKQFAPLYKLFCEKRHGTAAFRDSLAQYSVQV